MNTYVIGTYKNKVTGKFKGLICVRVPGYGTMMNKAVRDNWDASNREAQAEAEGISTRRIEAESVEAALKVLNEDLEYFNS